MQNYCFSIRALVIQRCICEVLANMFVFILLPKARTIHKVHWNTFDYLSKRIISNSAPLIEKFDRERLSISVDFALLSVYFRCWSHRKSIGFVPVILAHCMIVVKWDRNVWNRSNQKCHVNAAIADIFLYWELAFVRSFCRYVFAHVKLCMYARHST